MKTLQIALAAVGLLSMAAEVTPAYAQYGYGPPRGSYRRTCNRIGMDGPYLRAVCRTRYGDYRETQIDARRCGSVSNQNGRLSCGR